MAVPFHGHLRARLKARFHVQVQLEQPGADFETPAVVPVRGRVVRVFRGGRALRVGDEVRFSVTVFRRGGPVWPGAGFMWYDEFIRTTYMEAYLNGDPPACELPLHECTAIDGPTFWARLRASRLLYWIVLLHWKLR